MPAPSPTLTLTFDGTVGVSGVVVAIAVAVVHGAVMHNKIRIYSGARLRLPPLTLLTGFILFADPYQTRKVTCPTTKDDDAHTGPG